MVVRLTFLFHVIRSQHVGFLQADESEYAAAFSQLEAAAIDAERPTAMSDACDAKGSAMPLSGEVVLGGQLISAAQAQAQCGESSPCIIPSGTELAMDGSLNVAALVLRGGTLRWDDTTQVSDVQWLCAGYIAVESGLFNLSVAVEGRRAFVYLKDNGAAHASVGPRGFGGVGSSSTVLVSGWPLRRTWSLLAESAPAGANNISLLHDPVAMGWKLGDRLMLAPTSRGSSGTADDALIVGFAPHNVVLLSRSMSASYRAELVSMGVGGRAAPMSAEVINLDRNVVITGDALSLGPCPVGVARSTASTTTCTMGLHVIQMYGGRMSVEGTRVERCGQRGLLGKYCLHFHLVGDCPGCRFDRSATALIHMRESAS